MRFWLVCALLWAPLGWADEAQFGHLPYPEATAADLVTFQGIQLHKAMLPDLKRMLAAARRDGVTIQVLSGFRSIKRQNYLFYGIAKKRGQTPAERAKVSAPPGHSEHSTGLAVDLDDGDTPVRLEQSFADTKAGKWLAAHAARYNFELSFPPNSPQGVLYEPWHWRWVGDATRCKLFKQARTLYPTSAMVACP